MLQIFPTVKICHPDNPKMPLLINEHEFDPKKHKKWEDAPEEEEQGTVSDGSEPARKKRKLKRKK